MSKIIAIGTAVPKYNTFQNQILDYMHQAYNDEVVSRKLNVLFHNSGIQKRYSSIPDFHLNNQQNSFFHSSEKLPSVEDRNVLFKKNALPLALESIAVACEELNTSILDLGITHLISVTCTGLSAPGIDANIIQELNLPNDIYRTSVNFLGCNAVFHALKIADMICKTDAQAKVLIVSVELCTLHFQPKNNHDNLLSNTIFGDGAAALIVSSDAHKNKGLTLSGFYSLLLNKGKDLMGWNITPQNFEMILSAKIPEFIGDEVNDIVRNAAQKNRIQKIDKWAIHPGGKKIIDSIKQQLNLSATDTIPSYKILNDYGNMSSPTIVFVLKEIMNSIQNGDTIFAIGFGPGLSIETAFLSYE